MLAAGTDKNKINEEGNNPLECASYYCSGGIPMVYAMAGPWVRRLI